MELDVYFGGSSKKYIVNKYTKRFILALDVVKHILGSENNFEVLKVDRKGKLYNVVVMTDHDPLPAVLEISQVIGGVSFMARRSEACGFSPMVIGGDYSSAPRGVLTLILKECDKQGIDGYFLNAFWGYPVEAEPFGKFDSDNAFKESEKFWERRVFHAEFLPIHPDVLLFKSKLTTLEMKEVTGLLGLNLTYVGKALLSNSYRVVEISEEGKWFAYRGLNTYG